MAHEMAAIYSKRRDWFRATYLIGASGILGLIPGCNEASNKPVPTSNSAPSGRRSEEKQVDAAKRAILKVEWEFKDEKQ